MKDLNIQKEIEQIKKVSLTDIEKSKMLHNLSMHADLHMPVSSPFSIFSFLKIPVVRKLSYVIATVLITVLTGGSLAYASQASLPGDMLYSIKTSIVEPIKISMAKTPEAKAKIETELADTRLKEAENLEKVGKLTPEFKTDLNNRFNSHLSRYNKIKIEMEKENSTSSIKRRDVLQKNFEDKIARHKDILNKFDRDLKNFERIDRKEINKIEKSTEEYREQGLKSRELERLNQYRNPERILEESTTTIED